jgi:hypothetical protein
LNYTRIDQVSAINYTDGHRRKFLVLMPAEKQEHAPEPPSAD